MSTAKNKSSQDMIISSSLLTAKKKKSQSRFGKTKKKMLFSDQDAFLNDKMKRKKNRIYSRSSAEMSTAQIPPQISFWQPWNPSPFFNGLCSVTLNVLPYVNDGIWLWYGEKWEIHVSELQMFLLYWKVDSTISWLQRDIIFNVYEFLFSL